MVTPDMDEIKEIPGYKVIVKAILKNQIQQLVEQLASTTDEECVILTASLTDGSLSHLGSDFGKGFIEDHQYIKSQFLGFCLKKHYGQKQQESTHHEAETLETNIQNSIVCRNERSPRSGSLRTSSESSKERIGVRFKPYPMKRSRRPTVTSATACEHSQSHVIKELDKHIIKVELNHENEASKREKPSAPFNVITETNGNDDPVEQTTQSLVDSKTDNTIDETLPRLSVKLEAITETLKSFAEHDSELEYNDAESKGTGPETEPEIIGVELPRIMTHIPKETTALLDVKFETPSNDIDSQRDISETENTWSNLTNFENSDQSFQSGIAVQTQGSQTKSAICNKYGKAFDDSNLSTIPSGNHTIVKPFQCHTCSSPCSVDGEFNKPSAKKSEKNQHECDKCGQCFSSKRLLNGHLAIHTCIKPFKCETCGKSFTRKRELKMHEVIHSSIKAFNCVTCGESFPYKLSLSRHQAIHKGEYMFKCDICGKSFTRKWNLTTHLAIHSGVKQFKCDTCEKTFHDKCNLTRHLALHSGIKPFKCDTCGKSFIQKAHLKSHLAFHLGDKPYKCDLCGKSFTQKGNLTTHLTVHSGIKPFKCVICGKLFKLKGALTTHLTVHLGVKQFNCDKCGKAFNCRSNMGRH